MSSDGGKTWADAVLGEDLGRYSFRGWIFEVKNPPRGTMTIMARASNKVGQTQVSAAIFNPPGYHHNVVHSVRVEIA